MSNEFTTKPIKEVDYLDFKELLNDRELIISSHALDHIYNQQRKVYIEKDLTNLINKQKPNKIFIQANGRLSVNYRRKKEYLEVILNIEDNKITIVSFMNNIEIPRLKK